MPDKPEEHAVREATDETGGLNVEEEFTESESEDLRDPWDPTKIRVDPKAFSLRNVIDMIKEGDLELAPDFQRKEVWKPRQKSLLLESILLRIPLPAFYFSGDDEGHLRVIDGLQRLSTIRDFVSGAFRLAPVEYLRELEGKYFDDLGISWQRRILQTQIYVNIIDPQTPYRVKFDIFRRINTGGTPPNAQEIRHCMSNQRSRDFLKHLVRVRPSDGRSLERPRANGRSRERASLLRVSI